MQNELALPVTSSSSSSKKSVHFPDNIDFDKENEKLERRFRNRNTKRKKKKMASEKKQKEREEVKSFLEKAAKDDKIQSLPMSKNVLNHAGVNSLQELVESFDTLVIDSNSVLYLALKSMKADCIPDDGDTDVAVFQPGDTSSETSSENSDVFDGIDISGPSSSAIASYPSANRPKTNETSSDPMNGLIAATSNNGPPAPGNDASLISTLSVDHEFLNKLTNLAAFVEEKLKEGFLVANNVASATDCLVESIEQTRMDARHFKDETLRQLKEFSRTDRAKLLTEAFKRADGSVITLSTGDNTEENVSQ